MKDVNTSIFDFPTLRDPGRDCIYAADPRPVWYVAINYNAAPRTLDDPLCESVDENGLVYK